MNVLDFTLVVFAGSLFAGFLGSLTGLGGGVVIVPPHPGMGSGPLVEPLANTQVDGVTHLEEYFRLAHVASRRLSATSLPWGSQGTVRKRRRTTWNQGGAGAIARRAEA